jgi:hypothetical protein
LSDHFTTTKFSTVEQKAALANLLVHGALSTSDLAISRFLGTNPTSVREAYFSSMWNAAKRQ